MCPLPCSCPAGIPSSQIRLLCVAPRRCSWKWRPAPHGTLPTRRVLQIRHALQRLPQPCTCWCGSGKRGCRHALHQCTQPGIPFAFSRTAMVSPCAGVPDRRCCATPRGALTACRAQPQQMPLPAQPLGDAEAVCEPVSGWHATMPYEQVHFVGGDSGRCKCPTKNVCGDPVAVQFVAALQPEGWSLLCWVSQLHVHLPNVPCRFACPPPLAFSSVICSRHACNMCYRCAACRLEGGELNQGRESQNSILQLLLIKALRRVTGSLVARSSVP